MKHRYFAKPDHVVHYPGPRQSGQIHNYIGRQFVLPDDAKALVNGRRAAGQHRATKDGFEIDSNAPEAADLMRAAQQGGLWPADEATASAIGVPFTKLTFDESAFEWTAAATPVATALAIPKLPSNPTPKSE